MERDENLLTVDGLALEKKNRKQGMHGMPQELMEIFKNACEKNKHLGSHK